jgi:alpha-tubulin suppressor-like RCC1 family protein
MPTFYNFRQNGVDYSFNDVFVPADLFRSGNLWGWGRGSNGRLGNAQITNRSTPVTTFSGGTDWKQVSSGNAHTAAIKTDGTLWIWGSGGNGRLGTNDTTDRSTPVTTFSGGTDWKQVSSGGLHTAAIKTDGTLWTWGVFDEGQLGRVVRILTPITTFSGGTNWVDVATENSEDLYTISSGNNFASAIKTDGTLWIWGSGGSGRLGTNDLTDRSTPVTTFSGGTDWKQVNSGAAHTAAIKTDGTLWIWGIGSSRLGTNDSTDRSTPVTTFAGGTDWKQVSSGGSHTAAIKTDGTLWTWGLGSSGQLGASSTFSRFTPITTFAGGTNWKQVSAGSNHTAAIKTDGTLWTFGSNTSGQLGDSTTTAKVTPVTTFAGGTNWKQVSSGGLHTAAIKTDGTLWTWGSGNSGRLGNAQITNRSTPVTTFAGGTNWKQVNCGAFSMSSIKTDGTLWSWGFSDFGTLGINTRFSSRSTPVTTFAGGTNWRQVSASSCGEFNMGLRGDGTNNELFLWGRSGNGELGSSLVTLPESIPIEIPGSTNNWGSVSSGNRYTAAIKTDGTLWVWGDNGDAELGINDTDNRFTPVTTFAGGTDWKQVSAGGQHTAAIKTDGTLWTWGINSLRQLGVGPTDDNNRSTPVTTFSGGNNWKQVSNGSFHTAAIKTNGELWLWGLGNQGILGRNSTFTIGTPITTFAGGTDWKQVSAGDFHTAAIKTDGTLWTWGYNTYGNLGDNTQTNRLTPVTTFAGGTNWKQVSSGSNRIAATTYDDPVL